jgi:hypothetical protein
VCSSSAAACGPAARPRTALIMGVSGWCSAKGCSHPGMVLTGTKALETKVSGVTSTEIPWAAWAFAGQQPDGDEQPLEGS